MRAIARMQPATARLNGSVGDSFDGVLGLMLEDIVPSGQRDVHRTLRQLDAEAALIEFGDDRPLQLVALVQEREAEREADVAVKISAFSAQVMTVRGLITVEMSPFMKALRVRSATRTILLTMSRPSAVR